ncbi:hypothetical protein JQ506_01775 [Shinella sp. PSBB067]|uniref:hypothetical protein n=1 Tax=Shinella sp. PSBB067 TaxID=2715959 RepID=UPI00193B8AF3|nr:hypothetical protein [Shinella sp. PSBB067]QRI63770.1 hypothetical protein JQ506_01775 [Shinella sp. PSBB067]
MSALRDFLFRRVFRGSLRGASPTAAEGGQSASPESPTSGFDNIAILLERARDASVSMSHGYNGSSVALSNQVNELSDTLSVLYPTMTRLLGMSQEYERKSKELEKSNHQLTSKLRAAEEDLSCHRTRVAEGEAQIERISSENNNLKERVDTLEHEIARQGETTRQTESALFNERRTVAEFEVSSKMLETRLTKREAELLMTRSEIARLTNDLTETRMESELRQSNLSRMGELLSEAQASDARHQALSIQTSNELETVRSSLRQKEREADAARATYEADIERIKADNHDAQYKVEGLQSRVSTLERLLKSQRTKLENSGRHIAYLRTSMRSYLEGNTDLTDTAVGFDMIDEHAEGVFNSLEGEVDNSKDGSDDMRPEKDSTNEMDEGRVILMDAARKKV